MGKDKGGVCVPCGTQLADRSSRGHHACSPQYTWFLDKAKQILGHRTKQIWRHSKTTSTLAAGPCEEHRCVIKKIHVYLPVFSSCSREYEVYYKLSK